MNLLSSLFSAIANLFGWKRDADSRANAPEIKAAATGKANEQLRAEATKDVAEVNLDDIRKGAA